MLPYAHTVQLVSRRTAVKHCAACTMAGASCTLEVNDTSPGEPRSHLQRQCPEKLSNKSCLILVLVPVSLVPDTEACLWYSAEEF